MSSKKASLQRLASIVIITPDNINCGRLSNHNNISSQVGHLQSWESNTDMGRRIGTLVRNMLLLENPQFLSNDYEIMSK